MRKFTQYILSLCMIASIPLFTHSSSIFAGGVGPAEIHVVLPTLEVDNPDILWQVDYGKCVDQIFPWVDLPGFPKSEHHDVYFDMLKSDFFDMSTSAHTHGYYLFYRGHYPRSYANLMVLLSNAGALIPGKTKFIASPQGTCTFGTKEVLDNAILSRWKLFHSSSWPLWGIWLFNCQKWASDVVD